MRFAFFFLFGYGCIYSGTETLVLANSANDSTEVHIKFIERPSVCNISSPLADKVFSLDFISKAGIIKSIEIKSKDTVIKVPSMYQILTVPVEGFIYGRRAYFKIIEADKINIIVEGKTPMVSSKKNVNNASYRFWNVFYKTCPYYSVNKILFGSDLNKEESKTKLYVFRKRIYLQAIRLVDSIGKTSDIEAGRKDIHWLKELLKYEWLSDCLLASQQVKNSYKEDPEFTNNLVSFDKLKNDSLIYYPVYQGFLQNYLERVLLNDQRLHISKHGFSYRYYDVLAKIDSLPSSLSKRYLLNYSLEKINENFDSQTTLKAIEKIKTESQDSTLSKKIQEIREQIKLREQLNIHVNEFVTSGLKLFSLQDIIKLNKGKLLYVDIWASWCVPCRSAMSYSRELRENFKDKNIAFIYLSVDEDFDKWKRAIEQENLSFYINSFKVANPRKNSFLVSLNAEEIPRYLLFNKDGKLVHSNAPGPGSEELKNLLERYLKN